jgi:RNA polymerase sigma-70 factor (ECF subfamily)
MGTDDDLELLDRWCGGDASAGNALFRRHFHSIYRFVAHKLEGADAADDLVQEIFLACVRQRDRFQRQSSFRTYLFAIARHTLYSYWNRATKQAGTIDFMLISIASLSTSAGSRLVRRGDEARLLDALRGLPLEQQLLLELHYWEELERDQLAEVFEIEPATTRSRLFRARQALRERLVASQQEPATAIEAIDGGEDALDAWARSLRPPSEEIRNASRAAPTTGE